MQITPRLRLQNRIHSHVFIVLTIAVVSLLAIFSVRYKWQADWTMNNRHTLSEASQKLIAQMPDPINITAYATKDGNLRNAIKEVVERYKQHKPTIGLRFVDPFASPTETREQKIQVDGEMNIEYQGRNERVQHLTEQELTGALQRIARPENRQVTFLSGHGERSPTEFGNSDMSEWSQRLRNHGFEVDTLDFSKTPTVAAKTKVLVIANPQVKLLPNEIDKIIEYVKNGGNLFWLLEPEPLQGLEPLAEQLGLTLQPGMIVDPNVNQPTVVVIGEYSNHLITKDFRLITFFPESAGLTVTPKENWQATPLLTTNAAAWSETGDLNSTTVAYEVGKDIAGPLKLAFALSRDKPPATKPDNADKEKDPHKTDEKIQQQRVVVIGDSDFLSNAFLSQAGNLDLGMKIINWIVQDETFINVPTRDTVDRTLVLSNIVQVTIVFMFVIILPIFLIGTGIVIWLKRRKA